MAASQNDHNAAVAIKTNMAGWLQGAPLAAEQADVKASQTALDQAEQLQLQLQQQQVRPCGCCAQAVHALTPTAERHCDGHVREPARRHRPRAPLELRVRACLRERDAPALAQQIVLPPR